MKTKIKEITAICQLGTKRYAVGQEYNGMVIDRILDNSREYENSIEFIYDGVTKDGEYVFSLINAPVDIVYEKDEDK